PDEIPKLVDACVEGADMVVGERAVHSGEAPLRSRIGNIAASRLLRLAYPASPSDTQSGMRAFKKDFIQDIVRFIKGGRYETELYILLLALQTARKVVTVPIRTIYIDGNRSSHFRPFADAVRIYKAFRRFRRFATSQGFQSDRFIDAP
ncbi:MAG: hypothetical protein ACLGPL_00540, partial [Acidobacteriota bacterium]